MRRKRLEIFEEHGSSKVVWAHKRCWRRIGRGLMMELEAWVYYICNYIIISSTQVSLEDEHLKRFPPKKLSNAWQQLHMKTSQEKRLMCIFCNGDFEK